MTSTDSPLPESSVLVPRSANITNSDEWPEFCLNRASVALTADSAEPVSLLLAGEHYPLYVCGQVEPVDQDRAHLWRPASKPRPTYLAINDVRIHSYGMYEDGTVDVWAAGTAGWFRIVPSKKYRPVYEEMVEAVKIIYFVSDAYKTVRKTGKGKNAVVLPEYTTQELFEKYAIEVMGVEKAAPEAAKRFYRHTDFLLASMISEKEDMKWSKNPLYTHLTHKFPKEWRKVKQRLDGASDKAAEKDVPKQAPKTQHARHPSLESTSTTSSRKRKRGRPPKPDSESAATSSVADSVSVSTAKATDPAIRRVKGSRSTRNNPRISDIETEDSQSATATARESEDDLRRRRKSALRLKPNTSSKGPPKRGEVAEAIEDDESDDELATDRPTAPRSPANKRRKAGDLATKPPKQGKTSSRRRRPAETVDEGIDIPTSPSSAADHSDAVAGATSTELPIRNIEQDLLHRSDQLQENVWTCALDGCTHKVYGNASAPETQRLIREHYALHAYDDDERVQMVKRMAEPSLPVGHLVDKVRGFIGLELKRMEGTKVAGSRFPESVKTKY